MRTAAVISSFDCVAMWMGTVGSVGTAGRMGSWCIGRGGRDDGGACFVDAGTGPALLSFPFGWVCAWCCAGVPAPLAGVEAAATAAAFASFASRSFAFSFSLASRSTRRFSSRTRRFRSSSSFSTAFNTLACPSITTRTDSAVAPVRLYARPTAARNGFPSSPSTQRRASSWVRNAT